MPADVDQICQSIAELLSQQKVAWLDGVTWTRHRRTGFDRLEFAAPLAIGGVVRDGLQARISCRSDLPEQDVHAQLQVYVPALAAFVHVQRVEWRPAAPHTNNANAPAALRFRMLRDRWYEFGINRRLGLVSLRQTGTMIAQPLPREIDRFNGLLTLLAEVWNVSGLDRVPIPPWEDRLV